ncbi:histidine--tRNA ligase [Candidatus Woesebacteria bacterium]|nr:histidine--tRNA ligase [Candidatus Woesebacteria bacterium]
MKKTSLQPLRGFRDFLPEEALERTWLIDKIKKVFELWGYDPIETPTLEPLELFEGQIGEDEKLFFKFEDQGGRRVALRYDQTVPTARVIAQNYQRLPMPFRRYQIQTAFRAEKPQKGRFREFLQCDADIFGDDSPIADAEAIALSLDIYRKIGFKKVKAMINDRSLVFGIPYSAIVSIDKLKKIGREGVIRELIKKGIKINLAKKYLQKVANLKPNKTLETIFEYLEKFDIDRDWFEFTPTLMRAFSYSTGPIWEVEIDGYRSGSVAGGERYDTLVEDISGIKIPATGFSVGFDRTFEAASQFGLIPKKKTGSRVLVTVFNKDLLPNSIVLASKLRDSQINVEIYPDTGAKLDKQLKYADKKGIPWAIIIGPDEAKNESIVLKNLKEKSQNSYNISQLPSVVTIITNI